MTPDGCDVERRRTITHDSPPMVRDHRNLPIEVVVWRRKGLCDRGFRCQGNNYSSITLYYEHYYFIYLITLKLFLIHMMS